MTGRAPYVRPVTLPLAGRSLPAIAVLRASCNHGMITHRIVTTCGIYSASIPALRRGELSQLTTKSQAVDGLRGSFDNAVCVE